MSHDDPSQAHAGAALGLALAELQRTPERTYEPIQPSTWNDYMHDNTNANANTVTIKVDTQAVPIAPTEPDPDPEWTEVAAALWDAQVSYYLGLLAVRECRWADALELFVDTARHISRVLGTAPSDTPPRELAEDALEHIERARTNLASMEPTP